MKLFFHPTVGDGQNHSKNRAYRQPHAPDYLVIRIFFFFLTKTYSIIYSKKFEKKNQKKYRKIPEKWGKKEKEKQPMLFHINTP